MSNNNTIRVPHISEVKQVVAWGGMYMALHIPYIPIYSAKWIFKAGYWLVNEIDRLYTTGVITPMKGLVYISQPLQLMEAEVVDVANTDIPLFNWTRLQTEYDAFPHIRIIGKTGSGKTYTAEQILKLLGGEQWVVTCKKKPHNWMGQKVYGVPFDWQQVKEGFNNILDRMWSNYTLIEEGKTPVRTNVVIDEWRSLKNNVEGLDEGIREIISVARDAEVRVLCIATGEQVKTWGLEGESDLSDCFTTIRLKTFAIDHAKKLKLSKEKLEWLYSQERPCMVDDELADLNQLKEVCDKTNAQILQPSFENQEPQKTIMPTVLQESASIQNEVTDEYKMAIYRLYKSERMSDSDIVKNVMGYTGNRYGDGKKVFNEIIKELGNEQSV